MTAAAKDTAQTLLLQPYIFFYGRCEEALEFYKSAIGGSYEFQRVGESPMADQFSSEARNRVMHGKFTGAGFSFLVSDGREDNSIDPDSGNISLAFHAEDRAAADRIFSALANGGKVAMPLEDAVWGGRFGSLVDRFGIEWLVTTP
jgi:PhnB protein